MSSSIQSYYEAFIASQQFLVKNRTTFFPLDIKTILNRQKRVILQSKSNYETWCRGKGQKPERYIEEAVCYYYPKADKYLIVYNENKNEQRIRFSLAHELGHIVLGHLDDETTKISQNGLPDWQYQKFEGEANTFAGNLLAPPILLHHYNSIIKNFNYTHIQTLFKLSTPASKWRFEDYQQWKTLDLSDVEIELRNNMVRSRIIRTIS